MSASGVNKGWESEFNFFLYAISLLEDRLSRLLIKIDVENIYFEEKVTTNNLINVLSLFTIIIYFVCGCFS